MNGGTIYRVSGIVTAEDGTFYHPLFFGDFFGVCRVRDAIRDGARDRDETCAVLVDRLEPGGFVFVGFDSDVPEVWPGDVRPGGRSFDDVPYYRGAL